MPVDCAVKAARDVALSQAAARRNRLQGNQPNQRKQVKQPRRVRSNPRSRAESPVVPSRLSQFGVVAPSRPNERISFLIALRSASSRTKYRRRVRKNIKTRKLPSDLSNSSKNRIARYPESGTTTKAPTAAIQPAKT